ncbi:hypothetical protein C8R47DRAFT_1083146 [Mycena vitilis]|nr:hypothetical protein C8R47DRAFT_1083146 [Mycena vitilis]
MIVVSSDAAARVRDPVPPLRRMELDLDGGEGHAQRPNRYNPGHGQTGSEGGLTFARPPVLHLHGYPGGQWDSTDLMTVEFQCPLVGFQEIGTPSNSNGTAHVATLAQNEKQRPGIETKIQAEHKQYGKCEKNGPYEQSFAADGGVVRRAERKAVMPDQEFRHSADLLNPAEKILKAEEKIVEFQRTSRIRSIAFHVLYKCARGIENAKMTTYLPFFISEPRWTPLPLRKR